MEYLTLRKLDIVGEKGCTPSRYGGKDVNVNETKCDDEVSIAYAETETSVASDG